MSRDLWLWEYSQYSSDYLVPYLDQLHLVLYLILAASTGSLSATGGVTAGSMTIKHPPLQSFCCCNLSAYLEFDFPSFMLDILPSHELQVRWNKRRWPVIKMILPW